MQVRKSIQEDVLQEEYKFNSKHLKKGKTITTTSTQK